jgi:hypothetical protein
MAAAATKPVPISRAAAIAMLRDALARLAGPDTSICKAAAQRGIFCRGFRRDDEASLRARYDWIDERRPGLTRADLEDLGDRWQLARQELHQLPTACDVQAEEHDTCGGWDDFSAEELSRFLFEVTKKRVVVQ